MNRTEIRLTGFGGQGVVLAGTIIGRACAIHSDAHATMIQSFGPEARGSVCSTTLVVSPEPVLYPYIHRPDILVALNSDGYEKYRDELKEDGVLIYEKSLVQPTFTNGQHAFGVPSTRIAESLGRTIVLNIVTVGFFAAATNLVSIDQMREAVKASVPPGTEELNLSAFDRGVEYFERELAAGTETGATA
jgi:2-oxoglutarate ferredoxin oxidoreductase subunit gamma